MAPKKSPREIIEEAAPLVESTVIASPKEVEKIKPTKEVVVRVNELGSFDFKDHKELNAAASMAMQLNLVPEKITKEGGLPAAAAALMMCKQFNLPMKAMNEMGWIKGSLTVYGSLYWSLIERHPDYGEHEMFWIDEAGERISSANKNLKTPVWAAVIRCKKKHGTIWNEYFFTVDEAKKAGLTPADSYSPWTKYIKDMLMHKVKKRMGDANYASTLNGVIYHEDAYEAISQQRDVSPDESGADELKEAFLKDVESKKAV